MSLEHVRAEFPFLAAENGKLPVYLDSASSAQKPLSVIGGMSSFMIDHYANVHRGVYKRAEEATAAFEYAREKVAGFLNATPEEIIFTSGTTDALNKLALMLARTLHAGDEILVSITEHHSNFVPWQQLAEQHNLALKIIPITHHYQLDIEAAKSLITAKTKIIAVSHVSNVLGSINPIKEFAALAHEHGAVLVVDGAQAIAHLPVDVREFDVDYYVFSGHKLYGPTGIGVLYGKKALLEQLTPVAYGGEMVRDVRIERTTWNDLPWRLEPGTPHIVGAVGLGIAIDFLKRYSWADIMAHEQMLTEYALEQLQQVDWIRIIGPMTDRLGVISFTIDGMHPHDIAAALDAQQIAVRAGHHCTQPLHDSLGVSASARMSIGIYNQKSDIDMLVRALQQAQGVLRV